MDIYVYVYILVQTLNPQTCSCSSQDAVGALPLTASQSKCRDQIRADSNGLSGVYAFMLFVGLVYIHLCYAVSASCLLSAIIVAWLFVSFARVCFRQTSFLVGPKLCHLFKQIHAQTCTHINVDNPVHLVRNDDDATECNLTALQVYALSCIRMKRTGSSDVHGFVERASAAYLQSRSVK